MTDPRDINVGDVVQLRCVITATGRQTSLRGIDDEEGARRDVQFHREQGEEAHIEIRRIISVETDWEPLDPRETTR